MKRPIFRFAPSFLSALFAVEFAFGQAPEMGDAARVLYEEGYAASQQQDWALCKTKLMGAWSGTKHGQIAGLLGQCEAKLNQHRDAAEHLDYGAKYDPHPERRAAHQALLDEVKKKVAVLTITSEPVSCVIRIDVDQLGDAPRTVFVNPGKYTVEAKKDGYVTRSVEVEVMAGQEKEVEIKLSAYNTVPPSEEKPLWPAVVGFGLAAAGIGVGVGMTVAASNADGEAERAALACRTPAGRCDAPQGQGFADDRGTFQTIGVVGFAAGGALLLGSIIYLAVPMGGSASSDAAAFQMSADLSPLAQGIRVQGSF